MSALDLGPIKATIESGEYVSFARVDAVVRELEAWRKMFAVLDEALDVLAFGKETDFMRANMRAMLPESK